MVNDTSDLAVNKNCQWTLLTTGFACMVYGMVYVNLFHSKGRTNGISHSKCGVFNLGMPNRFKIHVYHMTSLLFSG